MAISRSVRDAVIYCRGRRAPRFLVGRVTNSKLALGVANATYLTALWSCRGEPWGAEDPGLRGLLRILS